MQPTQIWNDNLFEVSRNEYIIFMRRMKPDTFEIKEYGEKNGTIHIEVFSKRLGIRLCGRISNAITETPEKYYIWDYPAEEDAQEWKPAQKVVLDSPQQVQALLDALKKKHEEMEKGGDFNGYT